MKICDYCSATFSNKYNLDKHIKSMHSIEFAYTCEDCDFGFTAKDHIQNNHKLINCKCCSVSVKGLNELKKHVKQQHENILSSF